MATITEIRTEGTTFVSFPKSIFEPIGAPQPLQSKLSRFGDHYDLGQDSHLFRLLVALCGEAGAGSLKKELLYPKLQSLLESTYFNDLDRLYGSPLALPRLSSEIYTADPRNEALTSDEWADVRVRDSQYRSRCLTWMRAIIAGSTLTGIKLAAEAATGFECDVYERYKYLDNLTSDNPAALPDWGKTGSRQEFIIIPRVPSITEQERRRIVHLVDRIRPVNSIPTIYDGNNARTSVDPRIVDASTEGFIVSRLVTGRNDVTWPPVNASTGEWVVASVEQEAPTFAFVERQESVTYVSIVGVTASSSHIGSFSPEQRQLFQNISQTTPDGSFEADKSYAKSFAPVQLTIPWTSS